jgi:hypothetical protein
MVPWSVFVGKNDVVYTNRFPATNAYDSYQMVWPRGNYAWRKFVETGSAYTLRMNAPQNFPLIRLADVILMYAEAQNEVSGSPGQSVYDAVNAVRTRAGMPNLPAGLNKDQMREKIRHERKIELCGEGMRYSDIRRWKIAKELVDGVWMREFTGIEVRQRGFPDNFYLWAIPQQEITLNPSLEQNPGWD